MSHWQSNVLLSNLSIKQLAQLEEEVESHFYENQEFILEEGMEADRLFLIEKGRVEILKDGIVLAQKQEGDYLGVMALLDESKRSASARALGNVRLKSIKLESLEEISNHSEDSIHFNVLKNHLQNQQNILRSMNVSTVHETKRKLEEIDKKVNVSNFFLMTLAAALIYLFTLGILLEWKEYLHNSFNKTALAIGLIGGLGLFCYLYIRLSDYPLTFFGLSIKNWRKHIRESFWWSILFIMGMVIVKYLLIHFSGFLEGESLFDYDKAFRYNSMGWYFAFMIIYVIFCPIQEFTLRGVYQGSMEQLFTGKYAALKAILLSNLLFSAFHLHLTLFFAISTFVPGIFWGIMYARQRTLVGVSFSHILIGLFGSFSGII